MKRSGVWAIGHAEILSSYLKEFLPITLMALVSAMAGALSGVLLLLLLR